MFVEVGGFDFVNDLVVVFEEDFFGFVLVVYFFGVFEVGGEVVVEVLEDVVLVVKVIIGMVRGSVVLDGSE